MKQVSILCVWSMGTVINIHMLVYKLFSLTTAKGDGCCVRSSSITPYMMQ